MNKKHRIILIAALVILVLGSTVGVLAKYRSEQVKQAEMIAADFHFSSNYLEESKPTYSVSDWNDGLTIDLYNYEKENPALVSALDVGYTVTVNSDQFEVIDNGNGTLTAGSSQTAAVTIRPVAGAAVTETKITVTVNTTPYNEGLSATFELVGKQQPTWDIQNNGTHYTVRVYSNHYSGNVTLKWTEGLIPDATNDIVQGWTNGTFQVEPFHTYEIIFFNPSNVSVNGITLE